MHATCLRLSSGPPRGDEERQTRPCSTGARCAARSCGRRARRASIREASLREQQKRHIALLRWQGAAWADGGLATQQRSANALSLRDGEAASSPKKEAAEDEGRSSMEGNDSDGGGRRESGMGETRNGRERDQHGEEDES